MHHLAVSVQHSGLEPLVNEPQQASVSNSQGQQLDKPLVIDVVEEALDIRFHHEVVAAELELDRHLVDGIKRTFVRTIPIATAQEILLVDGFEYPRDRKLQQFVFDYGIPSGRIRPSGLGM